MVLLPPIRPGTPRGPHLMFRGRGFHWEPLWEAFLNTFAANVCDKKRR